MWNYRNNSPKTYRLSVELPDGTRNERRQGLLDEIVKQLSRLFKVVKLHGYEIFIEATETLCAVAGKAKDAVLGVCAMARISASKVEVS